MIYNVPTENSSIQNSLPLLNKPKYPPFTDQIPGLSLALFAKTLRSKCFWWLIFLTCSVCGMLTIVSVVLEYTTHNTATLISVKMVPSLELPAITICPEIPDALNYGPLLQNIKTHIPQITNETALDLITYWLAGNGLSYIEKAMSFDENQINELNEMYEIWSDGYDTKTFFHKIQSEYGYKCDQLFDGCDLNVKAMNCCEEVFRPIWVLKQGLCYQTKREINQTVPDDIGWLALSFKSPPSILSKNPTKQPRLIVYVNDNFEHIIHYPRYYLKPYDANTLHLNAKLIELQESEAEDCTNEVVGKNAACYANNWLTSHLIEPFNCTLSYYTLNSISNTTKICDPSMVVKNYKTNIVKSKSYKKKCVPGCRKWEYERSFLVRGSGQKDEQSSYWFELTIGYDELQYEHVKEIKTISISGLISQIGGQLGLYLGLSIITVLQIVIYFVTIIGRFLYYVLKQLQCKSRRDKNEMNSIETSVVDSCV